MPASHVFFEIFNLRNSLLDHIFILSSRHSIRETDEGLWLPFCCFGVEALSLTHSVAPSPALQDGAKKPCSGSTLSLWPDPRPGSRRVDFAHISRKFSSAPRFFAENEEISTPPPCGLSIGVYLFYENWSTETFRRKESKNWAKRRNEIESWIKDLR